MVEAMMDWIFFLPEILDMHLKYIAHDIIEHKEAAGFLNRTSVATPLVYKIENRRNDFIHALNILYFRIQPSEDEENPCHIIVAIGLFLFLPTHLAELLWTRDQFVFLFAGVAEEGDGESRRNGWEEIQLGLRSAGILLNLVPKLVVTLVTFPFGGWFVHHERRIGVLLAIQVLLDKICIDFFVELDLSSPLPLIFGEVA